MVSRNGALERATMFRTVISRIGDIAWSARSPELTVPDLFLWGFLKDRVFRRRIMTIQELQQAIVDKVATIDDGPTEVRVRQLPDTLATMH